ncbi:acyltransferase-domain-containing protein [Cantharellus anzutake]|uniref:acyltransferase-domain-containing protein n=1 Tax=Cantharellus anzutake TaxID=1750568 RepID=UPI0019052B70|nr:acyltransferase-domain-containing protein [Cantharellus anzutake]KAF8338170.1 acyltransferase-domain-containing protein [Cantharellus anzutake]
MLDLHSKVHSIPIPKRTGGSWLQSLRAALWVICFNASLLLVCMTQILVVPFRYLPIPGAREFYEDIITLTKASGGVLFVHLTHFFAPTTFVITHEGNEENESLFECDEATGEIVGLKAPPRVVLMANHQIYADWMYLWCLMYLMRTHSEITIILKKSLKHIPVLGWVMQFFRFIFLARSWSADRLYLGKKLVSLARRVQHVGGRFVLFIFPEGTLVSPDTRPASAKYAEKIGVPDLEHTLLPRSTGLLFCLRTLGPAIHNLRVMDVTVGYPGIPLHGYGQDHYTLRSIFLNGIPPPQVHIHIRYYKIEDIPIGEVSTKDSVGRAEASVEEATRFDAWLRERWVEKDRLMDTFYREGAFRQEAGQTWTPPVKVPIRVRHPFEHLQAYGFFIPVMAWHAWKILGFGIHKLVYT